MKNKIKSVVPKNPFLGVTKENGRIKIIINAKSIGIKDNCDTFVYINAEVDVIIDSDEIKCDKKCLISKEFTNFAERYST